MTEAAPHHLRPFLQSHARQAARLCTVSSSVYLQVWTTVSNPGRIPISAKLSVRSP
jgi:hypothetical protein